MNVGFHPEALQELEEAARYYKTCRPGLELHFIDCVEAAIQKAATDPLRWRIFDGEVRRCLVTVFPFAVLYQVFEKRIVILAIMHCHRAPGYWRHRKEMQPPA